MLYQNVNHRSSLSLLEGFSDFRVQNCSTAKHDLNIFGPSVPVLTINFYDSLDVICQRS